MNLKALLMAIGKTFGIIALWVGAIAGIDILGDMFPEAMFVVALVLLIAFFSLVCWAIYDSELEKRIKKR